MLTLAPGSSPAQDKALRQMCASELCFVAHASSTTHLVVCSQQVREGLCQAQRAFPLPARLPLTLCRECKAPPSPQP